MKAIFKIDSFVIRKIGRIKTARGGN